VRPLALLADPIFRAVEREFYAFSSNLHHLGNLENRKSNLSVLRSPSYFKERVDVGGGYSDPIWMYIERQEALEEEIAIYRLRVRPIQYMLAFLDEANPDHVKLFELKYRQRLKWPSVEMEMGISESTRKRMRRFLVLCGARFLGFSES